MSKKKLKNNGQPKDTDQVNICGVLIQTKMDKLNFVSDALTDIAGVDIHHKTDTGQLIVTIEDTPTKFASDIITEVHSVDGVLAASLVYHQCEDLPEVQKEIVL